MCVALHISSAMFCVASSLGKFDHYISKMIGLDGVGFEFLQRSLRIFEMQFHRDKSR